MQTTIPEESSIPYIVPHHLARNHHEELDAPSERTEGRMEMSPKKILNVSITHFTNGISVTYVKGKYMHAFTYYEP